MDAYRDKALEKFKGKSGEELKQQALEDAKRVAELLSGKLPSQQVEEYKAWVMAIAKDVANSAKEGGFLGVGGERVSGGEQKALSDIRAALGASDLSA